MNNHIQAVRVEQDMADKVRDWLLQVLAFAAAIVFGTWSILGWQEAKQANIQSSQANTLAFAAFCGQAPPTNESQLAQLCDIAAAALQSSVSAVAISLFGSPTATTTGGVGFSTTTTSSVTATSSGVLGTSSSTAAVSPTVSATSSPVPTPSPGHVGLSTSEISGIIIGVTGGIAVVLGFFTFCFKRRSL